MIMGEVFLRLLCRRQRQFQRLQRDHGIVEITLSDCVASSRGGGWGRCVFVVF